MVLQWFAIDIVNASITVTKIVYYFYSNKKITNLPMAGHFVTIMTQLQQKLDAQN